MLGKLIDRAIQPATERVVYRDRPVSVDAPAKDIARWCVEEIEAGAPATSREKEFITDMAGRWGKPTEKQAAWLAAIHQRMQRRARANGFRNMEDV